MRTIAAHRLVALALTLSMSLVTGCSSVIVGSFDGGAPPEGATFHISRATFNEDNTFVVFAKQGDGEGRILKGTYQFDGFSLKIKQAGKKERRYSATFNSFNKSLDVSGEGGRQTLKKM